MRFEYRILFGFLFALLLGISILNFVAIRMHKAELLSILYRDVHLHLELSEKVKGYKLPDYIKTSNRPLKAKDLVFYRIIGDKFVFLDFSRLRERLRAFALNLFLWEIFLILLLSFLFYRLLWHHLQERERNREFLELMKQKKLRKCYFLITQTEYSDWKNKHQEQNNDRICKKI